MSTTASAQIVPRPSASMPALRAADRGVAEALESVLAGNTQRVYATQWRLFADWCGDVGLGALPGRSTDRGPLPGRPRRWWRQRRHHAPGNLRHNQGA